MLHLICKYNFEKLRGNISSTLNISLSRPGLNIDILKIFYMIDIVVDDWTERCISQQSYCIQHTIL